MQIPNLWICEMRRTIWYWWTRRWCRGQQRGMKYISQNSLAETATRGPTWKSTGMHDAVRFSMSAAIIHELLQELVHLIFKAEQLQRPSRIKEHNYAVQRTGASLILADSQSRMIWHFKLVLSLVYKIITDSTVSLNSLKMQNRLRVSHDITAIIFEHLKWGNYCSFSLHDPPKCAVSSNPSLGDPLRLSET